jgi:hypothetical protein
MTTEGGVDCGCRDLHPEAQQFSLDALVAPAGILLGQAGDRLLDVLVQRWSFGLVRVGPGTGDEASVPAQQRPRPDFDSTQVASKPSAKASHYRAMIERTSSSEASPMTPWR